MAKKTCGYCAFWAREGDTKDPVTDQDEGFCHRYAPGPIDWHDPEPGYVKWPKTMAAQWCGDFKMADG